MHPTIKFMKDWLKTSMNFFYVTVSIAEGIIKTVSTDLYVKPTDSYQYLPKEKYFTQ